MNFADPDGRGKAEVKYLDGDFEVLSPGAYVLCAVTGNQIPIDDLRYWNVERQEAYASAEASQKRHHQLKD